jgi:hypothetical protein
MLEFGGNSSRQATASSVKNPATPGAVHQTRPAWASAPIVAKASCSAPTSSRSTPAPPVARKCMHHRADDLPAYLAIFIVGHIVVAGFMATDTWLVLESWQHLMIWIPITVILSLAHAAADQGRSHRTAMGVAYAWVRRRIGGRCSCLNPHMRMTQDERQTVAAKADLLTEDRLHGRSEQRHPPRRPRDAASLMSSGSTGTEKTPRAFCRQTRQGTRLHARSVCVSRRPARPGRQQDAAGPSAS